MKPRLFLIALCWMLVLLVPDLRLLLRSQTISPAPPYAGFGHEFYRMAEDQWPPLPGGSDEQLLAIDTENSRFEESTGSFYKRVAAAYEAALRRYPKPLWLRARLVTHTLSWMQSGRSAGAIDGATRIAKIKPRNFSQREWQRVFDFAQHGARREPENAFWHWQLAHLFLVNGRDAQARAALKKAAASPRYNTHHTEFLPVLYRTYAAKIGRPLLPEEQRKILMRVITGRSYRAIQLFTWQAMQAERRGDYEGALDIYRALLRVIRLRSIDKPKAYMRSYPILDSRSILDYRRIHNGVSPRSNSPLPLEQLVLQGISSFRREVLSRVASQKAQAAERELRWLQNEVRVYVAIEKRRAKGDDWFWNVELVNKAVGWRWGGVMILQVLGVALPLWAWLALLQRAAQMPQPALEARDVWKGRALSLLSLCALAWGAYSHWLQEAFDSSGPVVWGWFMRLFGWALALIPLLLWCWADTLRRFFKARRADVPKGRFELRLSAALQISTSLLLIAVLAAAMYWKFGIYMGDFAQYYLFSLGRLNDAHPLWPMALFSLALALITLRWLFVPGVEKPFVAYRFAWLRAVLGDFVALASVVYLVFGLCWIPARRAAQAEVNRVDARGEVTLMREALKKQ